MVAGYITNNAFRSHVENTIEKARSAGKNYVLVPSPEESEVNLHPGDHIGQIVAFTSPWIELDSSDPLVASASKQVYIFLVSVLLAIYLTTDYFFCTGVEA